MSLKHGILGFLIYGVDNGYELNKAFMESVDHFWHAAPSQIYRELEWLERHGMAESEVVVQTGKPNKKKFRITDRGRDMFFEWLAAAEEEPLALRSTFLMRIFFSGLRPAGETVSMLKAFETYCRNEQQRAEEWNQSIETYRPRVPEDNHSLYWQLNADFGRRYLKMCEEWAKDSAYRLEKEDKNNENTDH